MCAAYQYTFLLHSAVLGMTRMTGVMVFSAVALWNIRWKKRLPGEAQHWELEKLSTARRCYDIQRVCVLPTRLLRIPQHKQSMVLFMV